MTTETTGPIAAQRSAIRLLGELADQFADLPNAYITIHKPWMDEPSDLDFQLPTPDAFERWRIALGIESEAVSLHPYGADSYMTARTVRDGIQIDISAHGILLTQAQLSAPRTRDEVSA